MDRSSLLVFKSEIRSLVNSSIDNKCSLCIRCILRFCNVKQVFTNCTTDQMVADLSSFLDVIAQNINLIRNVFCNTCLDTLNDTFLEQICKQIECDLSEKSYLPLEDFQLQIHLPAVLTLRNSFFAKRLGLDKDETLSIKEVFKSLLASKLFKTINAKHKNDSNFIIELNFVHKKGEKECEQLVEISPETFYQKKCRKSTVESFINHTSIQRMLDQLNSSKMEQVTLDDIKESCTLPEIVYKFEPIYIGGRYMKYSRILSQTPWIFNGMSSVQERIYSGIEKYIKCNDIKFCSSGREDVDVRMLGNGRPFLLELLNPHIGNEVDLIHKISTYINETHQDVQVRDLQFVDKIDAQNFVKESEIDKAKTYQAICCLNRPMKDEDITILQSIKNLEIIQKTPIRVLHRRTLSDRSRTIYYLNGKRISINEIPEEHHNSIDNIFMLTLCVQAGTYIKEFVHSDFGRTKPNLCTLLPICEADIIALDVMEVKFDWPPVLNK